MRKEIIVINITRLLREKLPSPILRLGRKAHLHLSRQTKFVIRTFQEHPCNSKCVWCINQYAVGTKTLQKRIPFKEFKRFLELNDNYKKPLIPYGFSEPTIHPDFVRFCNYALDNGWTIDNIHTNFASKLKQDVFDTITRFTYVAVNFGGAKPETHYANMKTDLNRVFLNIEKLWKTKLLNNSPLDIQAKMIVNKKNIDEMGLLKARIENINPEIRVVFNPLRFAAFGNETDKRKFFEENLSLPDGSVDPRIPCRDIITVNHNGTITVEPKLKKCYDLIPTVKPNGSVVVCCRLQSEDDGVVGNAFEKPMKDIINSKHYHYAIKLALKRTYVNYCRYCS